MGRLVDNGSHKHELKHIETICGSGFRASTSWGVHSLGRGSCLFLGNVKAQLTRLAWLRSCHHLGSTSESPKIGHLLSGIPKTRHRGSSVRSAHHGFPVVKSYPIDSYRIYITWHKSPSYRTTILKQSISSIQIYPKIISRYHVQLFSFTSMKTYVT